MEKSERQKQTRTNSMIITAYQTMILNSNSPKSSHLDQNIRESKLPKRKTSNNIHIKVAFENFCVRSGNSALSNSKSSENTSKEPAISSHSLSRSKGLYSSHTIVSSGGVPNQQPVEHRKKSRFANVNPQDSASDGKVMSQGDLNSSPKCELEESAVTVK